MKTIQIKNTRIGEGAPKVIVPIMGTTKEALLEEINEVKLLQPDMIEWRADVFEFVDDLEAVKEMISKIGKKLTNIPFLFTFRSHKEGGNKEVTDEFYYQLLFAAIDSNEIDLVDIELYFGDKEVELLVKQAKDNHVFVILSNHDFTKTPTKDEIVFRLRKMQNLGADIPKIAVMPNNSDDVITLLDATNTMKTNYADRPIITMSMAGTGLISRLAGEVFGSAATFAVGRKASAPGQIAVSDLRSVLNILHNET